MAWSLYYSQTRDNGWWHQEQRNTLKWKLPDITIHNLSVEKVWRVQWSWWVCDWHERNKKALITCNLAFSFKNLWLSGLGDRLESPRSSILCCFRDSSSLFRTFAFLKYSSFCLARVARWLRISDAMATTKQSTSIILNSKYRILLGESITYS